MKFTETITVYNSVEVDFKKTLFPHLLNGVHVEKTRGAESAADGDKNTDNLFVIIPFKPHKNGFLKPLEYENIEDKTAHWTLSPGDVISIGDTGAADNFAELTVKAETFRIISVQTFDIVFMPHCEFTEK